MITGEQALRACVMALSASDGANNGFEGAPELPMVDRLLDDCGRGDVAKHVEVSRDIEIRNLAQLANNGLDGFDPGATDDPDVSCYQVGAPADGPVQSLRGR